MPKNTEGGLSPNKNVISPKFSFEERHLSHFSAIIHHSFENLFKLYD